MSQKGAVPLLLLIGAVGIISLMGVVYLAPFGDNLLGTLFPKQFSQAAGPNDWPQVAKDPQRSGFSAETLGTNFQVRWTKSFQPERVYPEVQAIIYSGQVFVGTEQGNLYALDATTGAQRWKFSAGSPILNSVAADAGIVYFGTMDGAVYGVNTANGTQAWKTQASEKGFSTAPLLADNKLMIGGRDGKFYAFNLTNGQVIWTYDAGAPILQTAAFDQGKAFFGSMDMFVHGVNTANGTSAWKSAKIYGAAFRQYWPVVTAGKVIITPETKLAASVGLSPGFPFAWDSSQLQTWLTTNGPTVAAGNLSQITTAMTPQANVVNAYNANPGNYKILYNVLNTSNGQTALVFPHQDTLAHNGTKPPPCVDRDGRIVIPIDFVMSTWARVDLNSQRIVDVLYDGTSNGRGNLDENMDVTCAQNMILAYHIQESNAQYTGYFNQTTRRWTRADNGWRNGQMFNNTQSGGANPASISNGWVYHISVHELVARSTN